MDDASDETSDADLLRAYRERGSQPAFARLAARHAGWVHAAARRRLGHDAHRADDVTQAVFVALAIKGPTDRSEGAMAAWMFRALQRAAASVVRAESRRRRHEALAATRRAESADAADDRWAEVAPRLDALVAGLGRRDREAVLLRFYRGRSHEAVGAALGISAEGARKRVARALETLRAAFARAGVTMPAVALGDALARHAAPPAPPSLTLAPTAAAAPIARLAKAATTRPVWPFALAATGVVALALVAVVAPRRPPVAATAPATVPSLDEPATRPATITLDELRAAIRRNEASVRNLRVVGFDATIHRKGPADAEWKPTPLSASGDAWFAGGRDGKARIDFARHVMPWEQGRAPFVDMSSVEAWDGQVGREIRLSSGYGGRVNQDNFASLTRERPVWLTDVLTPYYTGQAFALPFLTMPMASGAGGVVDASLSEWLDQTLKRLRPADAASWVRLAVQDVNGEETIRLSFHAPPPASGTVVNAFWFSPAKGFALVRRVEDVHFTAPRGGPIDQVTRLDVTGLAEAAPGVWLPRRASVVRNDFETPGALLRIDFAADAVVANDPAFDDATFAPPIPAGHIVGDERGPTRRDYVVWSDGSEHELVRGQVVPFEPRARPSTTRAANPQRTD